ncbi:MAG: ATP-binding cassette domain-containing protein, partial [Aristaeellaceae bacterium]
MIRTENLSKRYDLSGNSLEALHGVTLHIRQGEYAAIVGPSGSGKSTLMNILGCLDAPTSGTYRLHGRDVSTLSPAELARVRGEEIGFVFQG